MIRPAAKLLAPFLACACPFLAAAQSSPPPNLPPPPPIPKEVLESRPTTPPPDLPDPSELTRQLSQLEELLRMQPAQLKRLRQALEFIEKMSPDEREAMRIRLAQITQATPQLRAEIQNLAKVLDPSLHSDFSQFWLALLPDQRQSLRTQIADLPPNQVAQRLQPQLDAFIENRDRAFQSMQHKLEAKKNALQQPPAP